MSATSGTVDTDPKFSPGCHIRMKPTDMAIKLDHELSLTRSWDMQEFEAELFMMFSRPFEANLGGKESKYELSKFTIFLGVENWSRPGRDWISAGRGS